MTEISIKDVCFSYSSAPVLNNVSIDIEKSSFVSIVGPNGSGKSTLLKCINRLLRPRSGDISIENSNLSQMKRIEIARNFAYVPQSTKRAFPITVFETVLMGRRPYLGWTNTEEDREKVWQVLEKMGLDDLALCNFDELSGGQQQKILIARALVQDTGVILLDEPTSDLDIWHQLDVMETVKGLVSEKKVTVLMVVHDLNLAAKYSDQILILKQGKIMAAGKPASVLTAENIADIYGVEAYVYNQDDALYVMPIKQVVVVN